MNSCRSEIRMASISDIHLGHARNTAAEIVKNLRAAFPDNAETAALDIIWLAGDVFDQLLSLPDEDVSEIDFWIKHFLRLCKKHDIIVRVLEGTPSHDWKQSERFTTINAVAGIGADLKHVKDLSIEYIQSLDIQVLYVPDEWENTTDKTLSQVHDLLRAKGLDKVDYAIMHGQFDYQIPEHLKKTIKYVHSADEYLKIVRRLIFIGHVHSYSRYERIIAQGSFDRLAHGEENPKGHVRAVIQKNGEYEARFVENTGAKLFLTVDCVGLELEQTLAKVDQVAQPLPAGSHVRVEATLDNPILASMELLIRNYPLLVWSKKVKEEKEEVVELVEDETVYVPITLTRDNLQGLLLERLVNTGANADLLTAARDILKEVM